MRLLAIETATDVCSVCISDGQKILSVRENSGAVNHAASLSVYIEDVMNESNTDFKDLSVVAVSGGPGSYTGLRIGVSAAKGICFALDIPLIAVNTLEAMAFMLKRQIPGIGSNAIIQPMIDARRMEVFTAKFDFRLRQISEITSDIIDQDYFRNYSSEIKILCGGNGSLKVKQLIKEPENIKFSEDNIHSSLGVASIAEIKYLNNDFTDAAYFEPFYLKEFIPGKPKVKGLE
jgi:tRNA threonylcarbamoyladenosine biosynthesis protein TsaB